MSEYLVLKKIQKEKISEILEKHKKEFGKNKFYFDITLKNFLEDNIEYYNTLINNSNIDILNISILNGKIRFLVRLEDKEKLLKLEENKEFIYKVEKGFGVLSYGENVYRFKRGKNTFYIVDEAFKVGKKEYIGFEDIKEIISSSSNDENKMVYNAINYANEKIEETFKIKDFFLVEEKAYYRQY